MQPFVNMRIRFRKHFQLHEMSKKRAIEETKEEIHRTIISVKEGKTTFDYVRDSLKELNNLIRKAERKEKKR